MPGLMIFALDLEGVLAPEIWPILGAHFDSPDLSSPPGTSATSTSSCTGRWPRPGPGSSRSSSSRRSPYTIDPYLGARDFLARLRGMGQVVIISDTFHEFSEPLVQKLGGHSLFANRFELDPDGVLNGFKLRIRGQKERIVSGVQERGVPGGGDGRQPERPLAAQELRLSRPLPPGSGAARAVPGASTAVNLDEALVFMQDATRREENGAS